jgi:hypothetical protein
MSIDFMKRFLIYSKTHPHENLFDKKIFGSKIEETLRAIGIKHFEEDC